MKVVCIDRINYPELEIGKIYEADLIFFLKDIDEPMDFDKNFFNLEGFSEIDWFPTSHFMTLDKWREIKLSQIGI